MTSYRERIKECMDAHEEYVEARNVPYFTDSPHIRKARELEEVVRDKCIDIFEAYNERRFTVMDVIVKCHAEYERECDQ